MRKTAPFRKATPLWVWLKSLWKPTANLKGQAIRGSLWVALRQMSSWVLWFVRLVVLARLLDPKDFGLFGIALVAMSTLETFSQTGFQAALIQKKEAIETYLDVAWTVQVIRGMAQAIILFTLAPYIAWFFDEPGATLLLQVLALSALLRGGTNIGIIYFQKELAFDKQVLFQLSGVICDLVVAITCAWWLRNAWALVWGLLVGQGIQLLVSYFIHPYRPRLRFDGEKFKELYHYGKWIFGHVAMIALSNLIINALIGRLVSVAALGLYQMAQRIATLPVSEMRHLIQQVGFPVYAKVQDNIATLQRGYLKVFQITVMIFIPVTSGVILLAPEFIAIFLGEKWLPMTIPMQILSVQGCIGALNALTATMLQAQGRPATWTKFIGVWFGLVLLFIYPATLAWGIVGTTLVTCISIVPVNLLGLWTMLKTTHSQPRHLANILLIPLGAGMVMVVLLLMLKQLIVIEPSVLIFGLYVLVGGVIYLTSLQLLAQRFNYPTLVRLFKEFTQL